MNPIRSLLARMKDSSYWRVSNKYLKASLKREKNGLIVFICQNESIWGKSRSLFIELKNSGLSPKILLLKDVLKDSEEVSVFEKEFSEDVIKYEKGILAKLKPQIVFYGRPYENYLPGDLSWKNVLKHSDIAYIPYFYSIAGFDVELTSTRFLMCTKCYFAEQKVSADRFKKVCQKRIDKGLQECLELGYPAFDDEIKLMKNSSHPCSAFLKNNKAVKVLWNPRWSSDEVIGGSNFLKYKDQIFDFILNNDKYSFVFRPHPLLFDNFIANGLMKEEEKSEILRRIETSSNAIYDRSGEYLDTLLDTDILISDVSSLVYEFALSGKPFIYCSHENVQDLVDDYVSLLKHNYTAKSFDEIKDTLEKLSNNNDPKKEKREIYCASLLKAHENSTKRIGNYLKGKVTKK